MATLGHQFDVVFLPKNAIFAKISNDFDPHWCQVVAKFQPLSGRVVAKVANFGNSIMTTTLRMPVFHAFKV